MVTIKDVAKKAGVSISTASRTLHNNGYVSKANKRRVLRVANELGYIVNVNAMQLKLKTNNTIGIVVSDITNTYFTSFVIELRKKLKEINFDLLLTTSNNNADEERKQIKYLIGNKVSTILFIPMTAHNDEVLELARKNNIKLIQLFINVYNNISSIVNDDASGVYQAASLLVKQNYKRIALLDVVFDQTVFGTVYPRRSDGIVKAQNEYKDIQFKTFKLIPYLDFSSQIKKELEEFNPDAIIAGSGSFGLNVLEYLKTTSRHIKLISFDDNEWLEYLGITSIRQSKGRLVDQVINLINSENEENIQHITVDESLVLRD